MSTATPAFDLPAIRRYLRDAGWYLVDDDDRTSLWAPGDPIVRPEIDDIRLVLPATERFVDYQERVDEVLRALAFVERRVQREIVDDIALGGSDNVSVRLTPDTPSGEAPLDLAHTSITALRHYVVGSASGLDVKSVVLPPRRPLRAEAYVRDTRFSTAPGSFVLNLALPLGSAEDSSDEPTDSDALLDMPAIPYGRRVTNRMMQVAQDAVRLAARVGDGDEPLSSFARPDRVAVNATELEALAALGEISSDRRRYQLRFAQSPVSRSARTGPVSIAVTPSHQQVLEDAADFLRTKQPRSGVTVSGLVVRLARSAAMGPGDIVVQGIDDDSGTTRRFRLTLTEDDYSRAIRAHRMGLQVLSRGDVELRGNQRRLKHVTSFDVIDPLYGEE